MTGKTIMAWVRLLRPYQWSKNLLLVVPAVAAHRVPDARLLGGLGSAVLFFSLVASGLYAVNDVADVEHDRAHPTKRERPVASGSVSTGSALALAATLLLLAGWGTWRLMPVGYGIALGLYATLSVAYTSWLKRVVMLDVIVLAGLYTVRVVAGSAAVDVPLSRWFLAFSVFVFTSLALLKRAVEAHHAQVDGRPGLGGRGWRLEDLPALVALGSACAVAAALVYCFYITGDDVVALYARPDLLWLGLPVLLYWLSRVWLLALRGDVLDDPVLFALKDPASWASLASFVAVLWFAV